MLDWNPRERTHFEKVTRSAENTSILSPIEISEKKKHYRYSTFFVEDLETAVKDYFDAAEKFLKSRSNFCFRSLYFECEWVNEVRESMNVLFCRCIHPKFVLRLGDVRKVQNGGCMTKYCFVEPSCHPDLTSEKKRYYISEFEMDQLVQMEGAKLPSVCTSHADCPSIRPFCCNFLQK